MSNSLKKRGQKFIKKFSRASLKASEEGKEHIRENLFERFSHIRDVRLLIFEWGLLVLALTMLAVTGAVWSSMSYAEETFVEGGTFTEATIGRVNSLNPLFATSSSEKTLARLLFSTLVSDDYSGHVGPGLANYIRASEDGKIWRLKLREGLKWSDGEALTNEDVMFTLGLIQNPVANTIYESNLENVKISENSEGEIVFELAASYADFQSALKIPIVPKHILEAAPVETLVEADFSVNPVSSGAFMFNAMQGSARDDETVYYLSSNPNYYRRKPLLNSFAVHTYEDKAGVLSAISGGQVTATAELSNAELLDLGGYEARESSINAGAYIFFNTASGAMRNANLRAAIRQGINIETLRAAAPGTRALNYPLAQSQIELENYPAIPGYDFSTALSRVSELTDGQEVIINIATVNSGYLPAVSNALAGELQALGLEARITVYEETQDFIANVISKRNYDILVYEIELGADPDPLPYYHSSQANSAGLNLSSYRNSLVDDLLVGARETLDTTLRARKYESFLEYWVADVPAIGIYQANMTYIYNKNARVYNAETQLVTPLDRFIDVEDWGTAKASRNLTP